MKEIVATLNIRIRKAAKESDVISQATELSREVERRLEGVGSEVEVTVKAIDVSAEKEKKSP